MFYIYLFASIYLLYFTAIYLLICSNILLYIYVYLIFFLSSRYSFLLYGLYGTQIPQLLVFNTIQYILYIHINLPRNSFFIRLLGSSIISKRYYPPYINFLVVLLHGKGYPVDYTGTSTRTRIHFNFTYFTKGTLKGSLLTEFNYPSHRKTKSGRRFEGNDNLLPMIPFANIIKVILDSRTSLK